MVRAEQSEVEQEIEALKIEPKYLDRFYDQLVKNQQLPSGDIVPWEQYTKIVNYLREKQVLGEDNKIQPDGVKVFDSRRKLEKKLEEFRDVPEDHGRKPSGGMMPCSYESNRSGGFLPCR